MDPRLIRGQLRPGTQDPGGSWPEPTALTGAELGRVAVAFNGGFRLHRPSRNGYYSDHRTVAPLVDGKASLVLRTDGTADVGSWNQEVHMDSAVASVRQNLQMLVDHGQVNPTCATGAPRMGLHHRAGRLHLPLRLRRHRNRRRGLRRRPGPVGLHPRPHPRRRGRPTRSGARHQSALGHGDLLPPAPGRPAAGIPGRTGGADPLPGPHTPRLVRLVPSLTVATRP